MNRARQRPPWPFPGPATPTDRSRTVALGFRALAFELAAELDELRGGQLGVPKAKDRVDQYDQVAVNLGEAWVRPVVTTGEERVTRAEFAALAHVSAATVSMWSGRRPSWGACPQRGPDGKYSRAEVIEFLLARDTANTPKEHAA